MSKREITVGVTVNLKNYESLRIEVEDEVESEEDVRSLIAFLDQTLALFGRGNAETEELISHYRKRVLRGAIDDETGAPAATKAIEAITVGAPKDEPKVEPPAPEPPTPEPPAPEPPAEAPPAPKPVAKAPSKAPAKTPAPSPTGAVCEECGVSVSAAEEKTSRLFVSRVLCKKCIQSL